MQTRILPRLLITVVVLVLLAGAFSSGLLLGWAMPFESFSKTALAAPGIGQVLTLIGSPTGADEQLADSKEFEPFWETWSLIHEEYVDQPVDRGLLVEGAIRGMLDSLGDDHTSYMDPDQARQANAPLEGEYEGIGAWVDLTGEYLAIIGPMPNSPAEKAGLKPNDLVVAVDGEDMSGIDGNLVLRRILGPAGSQVTLTILRKDEIAPFEVIIERAKIVIPSIESEMLEDNIAYIGLYTFGDKTAESLRAALKELLAEQPDGLILDLRNNGGGYLNVAVDVASEFLPAGQIALIEQFGDGTRRTFKTKGRGLASGIPLVVLVNEGTASASEIVAGAIQDYQRGQIVGSQTFGKGTVQDWRTLSNGGIARVTIARWLTPEERLINKTGLTPDFVVELSEEDIEARRDAQLEKAVELLRKS